MDRSNHYEAAFEAYLRERRLCYVAVDETRRAQLGDLRMKSLDFIVYGQAGARLLVDVKGRRFPSGSPEKQRRVWESWSTREDVDGLLRWADLFGPGYSPLLVFAYHVLPSVGLDDAAQDMWCWRGRRYLLRAVPVADYREVMRVRSPKWGTVTVSGPLFRQLVRPFHAFTCPAEPAAAACPF